MRVWTRPSRISSRSSRAISASSLSSMSAKAASTRFASGLNRTCVDFSGSLMRKTPGRGLTPPGELAASLGRRRTATCAAKRENSCGGPFAFRALDASVDVRDELSKLVLAEFWDFAIVRPLRDCPFRERRLENVGNSLQGAEHGQQVGLTHSSKVSMLNIAVSSKLHRPCGRLPPMPTKDAGSTALGLRISSRRRELGLTQEQLAQKAKCTKGAVSQWETGDVHNLRLARLFRVADALGVEPRWLAIGEEPKLHQGKPRQGIPDKVVRLANRLAALPDDEQALLIKIFERTNPPS